MSALPPPIRQLYPFAPHYLSLGGPRMHYVDEGQGSPVVLLHGNPTWSFYYRDLIHGLRDRHRVIAPDHLGCGLSDKPQRYPYTLATRIGNLERLLDALHLDDFTLGVHDWGGAIGFGYARRHPKRVRRLIVFNTAAFFGRVPLRIRVCRAPVLGALGVRGLNLFARAAVRMACKNRQRMTPAVKAGYLFPYADWRGRVAIHRFVEDIPTRPSHPTYSVIQQIEAGLPQFRDRPMLVCWGMRDFCFTEAFLNGWVERFPAAEVHRFAAAGHYVVEDAGTEILPLVRTFLGAA
jgi:cis-3-alkyl-4-acyloxetan-2-one decarboxylase